MIVRAASGMLAVALAGFVSARPAAAESFTFPAQREGLRLVGETVKTQTFLKIRVYAVGLYVSEEALRGELEPYSRRPPTEALFDDLVTRDFEKTIVLRLLRDVSEERIRSALRRKLTEADPGRVAQLLSYFGAVESGTECGLRWAPGGTLEVTIGGVPKPPIEDRAFAESVFAVWLGDEGSTRRSREKLVANLASAAFTLEEPLGGPARVPDANASGP